MNNELQNFARKRLKDGLSKLEDKHHNIFKLMYSSKNMDMDINDVVDNMPEDNLDWAMQQVERTLEEVIK